MTITVGSALWNQRAALSAVRPRFESWIEQVGRPTDMYLFQWFGLYAHVLEFKPDLIIELGRGYGNSTVIFTEAANQLGNCRIESFCLSDSWEETKSRLNLPAEQYDPLHAHTGNLLEVDMQQAVGDATRVYVFWDAHGYLMAEYVLGHLLPLLVNRPHIIAIHDMQDLRARNSHLGKIAYDGRHLWRGGYGPFYLGQWISSVEQGFAVVDFTSRNFIPLHSADYIWHDETPKDVTKSQLQDIEAVIGGALPPIFLGAGNWLFFSLAERTDDHLPLTFPAFDREALLAEQKDQLPGDVRSCHAEIRQLRQELVAAQSAGAHWRAIAEAAQHTQQKLEGTIANLHETIQAMQSSKFWQVRNAWVNLKSGLSRRQGQPLTRKMTQV